MEPVQYWHIAHPDWQPGQPLRCRDELLAEGHDVPWLWDEADEGLDGDIVCLFPDTEQGRKEAGWLLDDRPGYRVVHVDLPEGVEVTRASWEDYPAVRSHVPAEHLTLVNEIA